MDEATWYLDSDDSSPLGSPSTPPTLNGEWPCHPSAALLAVGTMGRLPETSRHSKASPPGLTFGPMTELDTAQALGSPESGPSASGLTCKRALSWPCGCHCALGRL